MKIMKNLKECKHPVYSKYLCNKLTYRSTFALALDFLWHSKIWVIQLGGYLIHPKKDPEGKICMSIKKQLEIQKLQVILNQLFCHFEKRKVSLLAGLKLIKISLYLRLKMKIDALGTV